MLTPLNFYQCIFIDLDIGINRIIFLSGKYPLDMNYSDLISLRDRFWKLYSAHLLLIDAQPNRVARSFVRSSEQRWINIVYQVLTLLASFIKTQFEILDRIAC